MGKRTESQLEKLKFGAQDWNEVLSRNAERLNDILLRVDGLLDVDINNLKDGDVLWWNEANQKFENVPKAYAVSAASVSSASLISSTSSESSESSESSNSSELILSQSSSSESSESSESSFSCSNWAGDQTSGETFTASDYHSTYVPANAFDDNNSTSWIVDVPGGWEWIGVEFALDKAIMQLRVRSANVGWANTPNDLQLKVSATGDFVGEETTLLDVTGLTWSQDEWKEWYFDNSLDKKYYRLYVNGSGLSQYNIAEIEMMECNDYSVSSESSESSLSSESSESSESSSSSSVSACAEFGPNISQGRTYDANEQSASAGSAFDNQTAEWSTWTSDIVPGTSWIEVDFGSGFSPAIRKIGVYTSVNAVRINTPQRWRIRGSNTGAFGGEEVELHDTGVQSLSSNNTWYYVEFENTTFYRYYRIYGTDAISNTYHKFNEIRMYECTDNEASESSSSESSQSSETVSSDSSDSSYSSEPSESSESSSSSWSCFIEADDDFTGTNGDPPNPHRWEEIRNDNDSASIQSNKLNFQASGDNNYKGIYYSNFTISGDFSIQIDYDITSFTQPTDGNSRAAGLVAYEDGGSKYAIIYRSHTAAAINGYESLSDTIGTDQFTRNDSSGKLRLVRTGSTIVCYYDTGSQWEWNGNTSGRTLHTNFSGAIYVRLLFEQENNTTMNTNMDNFTVNYGTVDCADSSSSSSSSESV